MHNLFLMFINKWKCVEKLIDNNFWMLVLNKQIITRVRVKCINLVASVLFKYVFCCKCMLYIGFNVIKW